MTESPDVQPPQTDDEPPGPVARMIYAAMFFLGTWGFARWLLAGAPLQGDKTFSTAQRYMTPFLMVVLIGCGLFGLWRARKVLMNAPKNEDEKSS